MSKLERIRANGFQFKQFFVAHDKCEMKVNTDGILLGAYAPVLGKRSILDIGTGSGLIALMLAQRAESAAVLGIEIDHNAALQAEANFKDSEFSKRLEVYAGSLQSYLFEANNLNIVWTAKQSNYTLLSFDLIVSNPPYYPAFVASRNARRDIARSNIALNYDELILAADQLLTGDGEFYLILPVEVMNTFLVTLERLKNEKGIDLVLHDLLMIHSLPNKPAKRSILGFTRANNSVKNKKLIPEQKLENKYLEFHSFKKIGLNSELLENVSHIHKLIICNEPNQYTDAYRQLTRGFYLNH